MVSRVEGEGNLDVYRTLWPPKIRQYEKQENIQDFTGRYPDAREFFSDFESFQTEVTSQNYPIGEVS